MVTIIQHHEKYKEIHGEDKIVMLSVSEHKKLHIRLRKEGKCNIPVETLRKISQTAHGRTESHKQSQKEYWAKPESKDKQKDRNQLPHIKQLKREYRIRAEQRIEFLESVGKNALLYETIIYNQLNNNVYIVARFQGNHKLNIPVVEI